MSRSQRDKGRKGEREVAAEYERRDFEVRGLEGAGDHLIVCDPSSRLVFHSEVKRQEVARPWLWHEQAASEAPAGAIALVHFRRNRSPWLVLVELDAWLGVLVAHRALGRRVAELEAELEALRSDA